MLILPLGFMLQNATILASDASIVHPDFSLTQWLLLFLLLLIFITANVSWSMQKKTRFVWLRSQQKEVTLSICNHWSDDDKSCCRSMLPGQQENKGDRCHYGNHWWCCWDKHQLINSRIAEAQRLCFITSVKKVKQNQVRKSNSTCWRWLIPDVRPTSRAERSGAKHIRDSPLTKDLIL